MKSFDLAQADDLEAIVEIARAAAREAAVLVLGGFRRSLVVEHKGAVDLVTRFDRESETLLKSRLGSQLPFAIVGEEQGGGLPEDGIALYVDPIDGTTNFVHGHPFWCVSIGLVAKGVPVLGVVVAPPLGIEWTGWTSWSEENPDSGERRAIRRSAPSPLLADPSRPGAAVVDEPCSVSKTATFEDAFLATGFPYDRRTSSDDNFDAFVAIKKQCQAVRRCGSAALDCCLVADGTYDGYWERKVKPWDIAGGGAIVRAAGGRVTDFTGGPGFIEGGRILATNGAVHDGLMAALARG